MCALSQYDSSSCWRLCNLAVDSFFLRSSAVTSWYSCMLASSSRERVVGWVSHFYKCFIPRADFSLTSCSYLGCSCWRLITVCMAHFCCWKYLSRRLNSLSNWCSGLSLLFSMSMVSSRYSTSSLRLIYWYRHFSRPIRVCLNCVKSYSKATTFTN